MTRKSTKAKNEDSENHSKITNIKSCRITHSVKGSTGYVCCNECEQCDVDSYEICVNDCISKEFPIVPFF